MNLINAIKKIGCSEFYSVNLDAVLYIDREHGEISICYGDASDECVVDVEICLTNDREPEE